MIRQFIEEDFVVRTVEVGPPNQSFTQVPVVLCPVYFSFGYIDGNIVGIRQPGDEDLDVGAVQVDPVNGARRFVVVLYPVYFSFGRVEGNTVGVICYKEDFGVGAVEVGPLDRSCMQFPSIFCPVYFSFGRVEGNVVRSPQSGPDEVFDVGAIEVGAVDALPLCPVYFPLPNWRLTKPHALDAGGQPHRCEYGRDDATYLGTHHRVTPIIPAFFEVVEWRRFGEKSG